LHEDKDFLEVFKQKQMLISVPATLIKIAKIEKCAFNFLKLEI
jgi:hypothetical protein